MANHDLAALQEQLQVHMKHFAQHERDELKRHLEFKLEQEANRDRIDKLCASTETLVDAWEALGGAVKMGVWAGKFIKWASGLALISSAISWLAKYGG